MAKKTLKECRICGASFQSNTDFGVHIAKKHDVRIGGNDKLPLRDVSCWRCAGDININETSVCSCGFVFPLEMFTGQGK